MYTLSSGVLWFGTHRRDWDWADTVSMYIARKLQFLQLLLQMFFCNEPKGPDKNSIAVR